MNPSAMYQLSYGLFVLTARQDGFDNGCVVNTVQQVTSSPNRIVVAVNKQNRTHDMIAATGAFNVSILSTDAPFDLFRHFGFQSGHTVDKITPWPDCRRSENGLVYLGRYANAFLSARVVQQIDLGTHTLFLADVTDGEVLSREAPVTYAYYHANIKPQAPKPSAPPEAGAERKVKGWRCRICGYVYDGEALPKDFVCPICKHGAEDFEPIY